MSDRAQVLAFWRARLRACQEQLDLGSPQLRWLRRAYLRIYRFLLAQYAESDDAASRPSSALTAIALSDEFDPPSRMPLVDNTADHFGRAPKSVGKIQAVLKHIHNANDRPTECGPLATGVSRDDWAMVATRRDRWSLALCLRLLNGQGIKARIAHRGGDAVVEVTCGQLALAQELLNEHREVLRNRTKPASRRVMDAVSHAIVVGLGGMALGLIFATGLVHVARVSDQQANTVLGVSLVVGWALGAVIGALIGFHRETDRTQRRDLAVRRP
jgi:hypothetical protein